jgi:tetratricopeptide (TPR) repeat protein
MKELKYLLLLILMNQLAFSLLAQIQTGSPWMNQPSQGVIIDGTGPEFVRQTDMHAQRYNIEQTATALNDAVSAEPNSVEALVRRATFNRRIGRVHEAEIDISRVNQLNPYAANLYGYYGHSSMVKLMAFEPLDAMSSSDPQAELQPYFRLIDSKNILDGNVGIESDLLYEIIRDIEAEKYEEALHLTEAMIVLYPESAISWDLKGMIYEKLGDNEKAVVSFSEAIVINEDFAIAWYNLARMMLKNEDIAQAQVYLDHAIDLENTLTEAYFKRAMVRKSLGDEGGAVADYSSIIEQETGSSMAAYQNRGLTKKMLGNFSGALSDINKVIEAEADEAGQALLYKNRANLMLLFGHHKEAIADYTTAISLDASLAEAYYNRGLTLLKINRPIEACNDLETSAQLGYQRATEKTTYFCKE